MLVETGTPGIPAVFALAFVSNLFATLTPYASAQSAPFGWAIIPLHSPGWPVGLAFPESSSSCRIQGRAWPG
eukprot:g33252.t1